MAFDLVDSFNLDGGQWYENEDDVWMAERTILLQDLEALPDESRLSAYLYLRVFVPAPFAEKVTIATFPIYTKNHLFKNPVPEFTGINISFAIYRPFGNFRTDYELYVE